ncbi:OLC1v1008717C1 [Oldenlandia corymbosa var. corymbosa]|uniref:OLC1v1008717C1 n=1 Tax=Oldenlandia corymbosa var. corymbosa TaxID=529605 RepID=A0AAV1DMT3_OLDCO|nr:OLC1v1008717C1 [Oldenlandia corymbosa var. corymbosa]
MERLFSFNSIRPDSKLFISEFYLAGEPLRFLYGLFYTSQFSTWQKFADQRELKFGDYIRSTTVICTWEIESTVSSFKEVKPPVESTEIPASIVQEESDGDLEVGSYKSATHTPKESRFELKGKASELQDSSDVEVENSDENDTSRGVLSVNLIDNGADFVQEIDEYEKLSGYRSMCLSPVDDYLLYYSIVDDELLNCVDDNVASLENSVDASVNCNEKGEFVRSYDFEKFLHVDLEGNECPVNVVVADELMYSDDEHLIADDWLSCGVFNPFEDSTGLLCCIIKGSFDLVKWEKYIESSMFVKGSFFDDPGGLKINYCESDCVTIEPKTLEMSEYAIDANVFSHFKNSNEMHFNYEDRGVNQPTAAYDAKFTVHRLSEDDLKSLDMFLVAKSDTGVLGTSIGLYGVGTGTHATVEYKATNMNADFLVHTGISLLSVHRNLVGCNSGVNEVFQSSNDVVFCISAALLHKFSNSKLTESNCNNVDADLEGLTDASSLSTDDSIADFVVFHEIMIAEKWGREISNGLQRLVTGKSCSFVIDPGDQLITPKGFCEIFPKRELQAREFCPNLIHIDVIFVLLGEWNDVVINPAYSCVLVVILLISVVDAPSSVIGTSVAAPNTARHKLHSEIGFHLLGLRSSLTLVGEEVRIPRSCVNEVVGSVNIAKWLNWVKRPTCFKGGTTSSELETVAFSRVFYLDLFGNYQYAVREVGLINTSENCKMKQVFFLKKFSWVCFYAAYDGCCIGGLDDCVGAVNPISSKGHDVTHTPNESIFDLKGKASELQDSSNVEVENSDENDTSHGVLFVNLIDNGVDFVQEIDEYEKLSGYRSMCLSPVNDYLLYDSIVDDELLNCVDDNVAYLETSVDASVNCNEKDELMYSDDERLIADDWLSSSVFNPFEEPKTLEMSEYAIDANVFSHFKKSNEMHFNCEDRGVNQPTAAYDAKFIVHRLSEDDLKSLDLFLVAKSDTGVLGTSIGNLVGCNSAVNEVFQSSNDVVFCISAALLHKFSNSKLAESNCNNVDADLEGLIDASLSMDDSIADFVVFQEIMIDENGDGKVNKGKFLYFENIVLSGVNEEKGHVLHEFDDYVIPYPDYNVSVAGLLLGDASSGLLMDNAKDPEFLIEIDKRMAVSNGLQRLVTEKICSFVIDPGDQLIQPKGFCEIFPKRELQVREFCPNLIRIDVIFFLLGEWNDVVINPAYSCVLVVILLISIVDAPSGVIGTSVIAPNTARHKVHSEIGFHLLGLRSSLTLMREEVRIPRSCVNEVVVGLSENVLSESGSCAFRNHGFILYFCTRKCYKSWSESVSSFKGGTIVIHVNSPCIIIARNENKDLKLDRNDLMQYEPEIGSVVNIEAMCLWEAVASGGLDDCVGAVNPISSKGHDVTHTPNESSFDLKGKASELQDSSNVEVENSDENDTSLGVLFVNLIDNGADFVQEIDEYEKLSGYRSMCLSPVDDYLLYNSIVDDELLNCVDDNVASLETSVDAFVNCNEKGEFVRSYDFEKSLHVDLEGNECPVDVVVVDELMYSDDERLIADDWLSSSVFNPFEGSTGLLCCIIKGSFDLVKWGKYIESSMFVKGSFFDDPGGLKINYCESDCVTIQPKTLEMSEYAIDANVFSHFKNSNEMHFNSEDHGINQPTVAYDAKFIVDRLSEDDLKSLDLFLVAKSDTSVLRTSIGLYGVGIGTHATVEYKATNMNADFLVHTYSRFIEILLVATVGVNEEKGHVLDEFDDYVIPYPDYNVSVAGLLLRDAPSGLSMDNASLRSSLTLVGEEVRIARSCVNKAVGKVGYLNDTLKLLFQNTLVDIMCESPLFTEVNLNHDSNTGSVNIAKWLNWVERTTCFKGGIATSELETVAFSRVFYLNLFGNYQCVVREVGLINTSENCKMKQVFLLKKFSWVCFFAAYDEIIVLFDIFVQENDRNLGLKVSLVSRGYEPEIGSIVNIEAMCLWEDVASGGLDACVGAVNPISSKGHDIIESIFEELDRYDVEDQMFQRCGSIQGVV